MTNNKPRIPPGIFDDPTFGLRDRFDQELIPVDAVRWWSITSSISDLDAQTTLAAELEIQVRDRVPHIRHEDLLAATRGPRLNTLRRRITDSMDHIINHECGHADLLAAPDRLRNSLREALRLDPEEGAQLLRWVNGYFPDIASEIQEARP